MPYLRFCGLRSALNERHALSGSHAKSGSGSCLRYAIPRGLVGAEAGHHIAYAVTEALGLGHEARAVAEPRDRARVDGGAHERWHLVVLSRAWQLVLQCSLTLVSVHTSAMQTLQFVRRCLRSAACGCRTHCARWRRGAARSRTWTGWTPRATPCIDRSVVRSSPHAHKSSASFARRASPPLLPLETGQYLLAPRSTEPVALVPTCRKLGLSLASMDSRLVPQWSMRWIECRADSVR